MLKIVAAVLLDVQNGVGLEEQHVNNWGEFSYGAVLV